MLRVGESSSVALLCSSIASHFPLAASPSSLSLRPSLAAPICPLAVSVPHPSSLHLVQRLLCCQPCRCCSARRDACHSDRACRTARHTDTAISLRPSSLHRFPRPSMSARAMAQSVSCSRRSPPTAVQRRSLSVRRRRASTALPLPSARCHPPSAPTWSRIPRLMGSALSSRPRTISPSAQTVAAVWKAAVRWSRKAATRVHREAASLRPPRSRSRFPTERTQRADRVRLPRCLRSRLAVASIASMGGPLSAATAATTIVASAAVRCHRRLGRSSRAPRPTNAPPGPRSRQQPTPLSSSSHSRGRADSHRHSQHCSRRQLSLQPRGRFAYAATAACRLY